jgi:hypothetical protein
VASFTSSSSSSSSAQKDLVVESTRFLLRADNFVWYWVSLYYDEGLGYAVLQRGPDPEPSPPPDALPYAPLTSTDGNVYHWDLAVVDGGYLEDRIRLAPSPGLRYESISISLDGDPFDVSLETDSIDGEDVTYPLVNFGSDAFSSSSSSSSKSSFSSFSSQSSSSSSMSQSSSSSTVASVTSSSSSTAISFSSSSSPSTEASRTSSSSSSELANFFLGVRVFDWQVDWPVSGKWEYDQRALALGFGPEFADPKQEHVVHGWEFSATFREEEISEVDRFLDSIEGRTRPFWLPGPLARFRVDESEGDHTFIVEDQSAEEDWQLQPGRYLWLHRRHAPGEPAKIVSVTDLGDGRERIVVESATSDEVGTDWQVAPLYLVRLADDSEQVSVGAERLQRRTFRVVEVPTDYDLLPGQAPEPSEPVYLYRFWAELPDGVFAWRFTSHPTDLFTQDAPFQSSSSSSSKSDKSSSTSLSSASTPSSSSSSTAVSFTSSSSSSDSSGSSSSSGISYSTGDSYSSSSKSQSSSSSSSSSTTQTSSSSFSSSTSSASSGSDSRTSHWLSARIEHSRLSRSVRNGGTVSIVGDYDSIEPLRLLCPQRLPVPLWLEILKTNRTLDETESLFKGTPSGKPEMVGRKVSAGFAEFGDAMSTRVPGFYIQRNCNYRVYDADTCRASRAIKEKTVTAVALDGRVLTVQGSGLVGMVQNWFAYGWLEIGSGLTRRNYYVTASSEATHDLVALVLTQPPDIELPASGALVPGCGGTKEECVAKFDNFVNFGGHETPKDNLTLNAIRTEQNGGKK